MKKQYRIILIFSMSFLSLLAIFMIQDISNIKDVTGSDLVKLMYNLARSFPALNITHLFTFVFIYHFYNQYYFKGEKIKKSMVFLSVFFAMALVFGYSFSKVNSTSLIFSDGVQIFKSIIKLLGYYFIIYILIKKLLDYIKLIAQKDKVAKNKYLNFIFDKHPNICITAILIIVWLPIIIIQFPGVIGWDAVTQINQLLGKYQGVHINIINPSVALNNHHPILTTLIYGMFINIGKFLNSVDVGIFLYMLAQLAFMIYTIIYSFRIMNKMQVSNKIKLVALIFYALCPIFCVTSTNILKDMLFSIFMFYYVLIIIEILLDKDILKKKIYLLKLPIILLFIILIRNNGLYTILLSFPILFFIVKTYRKRLIVILVIPLTIYILLNKLVYPIFEISPGSIKEALSIPFQQTARTLSEGKEYSKKDLERINKILNVETIKDKYNPVLSDPVKNTFNKKYETNELVDYFKVWIKYFFKYPGTYIEGALNTTYGYWYPNKKDRVGEFRIRDDFKQENPYNMKCLETFQNNRYDLEAFFNVLETQVPLIGTLLSAGFYTWMLLILSLYILLSKDKKYIIANIALISIVLVCLASPYFAIRYMLCVVYCLPILLCNCIYVYKNKENNDNKENKEKNNKKGELINE